MCIPVNIISAQHANRKKRYGYKDYIPVFVCIPIDGITLFVVIYLEQWAACGSADNFCSNAP